MTNKWMILAKIVNVGLALALAAAAVFITIELGTQTCMALSENPY